jgi:hypothetical protein
MKNKKYQEKVYCDGNGNILVVYPNMCGCHPNEFTVDFPYKRNGGITVRFNSYLGGMRYYNANYTFIGNLN